MGPTATILSPHLDDAVLSCWHLLTTPGDLQVINVFAGVPPVDSATGWWDRTSGYDDSARLMRERIAEDRRALALAGRSAVNLDFIDNQYRGGPQRLEPLLQALVETLPAEATIYAPASLAPTRGHPAILVRGPHPDHLAVRTAALALHAQGWPVVLYADLPHARPRGGARPGAGVGERATDLDAVRWWEGMLSCAGVVAAEPAPRVRALSFEEFHRKVEAIHAYASQLDAIEAVFGIALDDPALLGHEVEWLLPATAAAV